MMNNTQFVLPDVVSSTIFRAYDIRGIIGNTVTPDIVFAIGLAIGSKSQRRGERQVIVARDGRLSGPLLISALQEGLMASGCDVIDIGMTPTPLLYFATHVLQATSGVMLTGSHNPADYNGLKIVVAGETVTEDDIQKLYQRILVKEFTYGHGRLKTTDIINEYIAQVTRQITLVRPLKVVVDCGNGVGGVVVPALLRAIGCEVVELFCEVDGNFPNHHPDPSHPDNLQDLIRTVRQQRADIGLAFDGDADRLGVVTNEGEIIWPDRQLMLYAIDVLSKNPDSCVVYDIKCTNHLAKIIEQYGGKPVMWKTGHSLMKTKMRETGAILGGEMSGHIFFKDNWYGFDDALYTAARLLAILAADKRSLSEIFQALPDAINTPELKLAISDEQKFKFIQELIAHASFQNGRITTIDGLRVDFPDGWGLVRPSNTTPCLVLRFEADTASALLRIQEVFRQQLLAIDSSLLLPF